MKWINVKERLPKLNTPVLILGKPYENKPKMFAVAIWNFDDWEKPESSFDWFEIDEMFVDAMSDYTDSNITHWMPLPEPPKE
jgi:hypothetical protein